MRCSGFAVQGLNRSAQLGARGSSLLRSDRSAWVSGKRSYAPLSVRRVARTEQQSVHKRSKPVLPPVHGNSIETPDYTYVLRYTSLQ